jgi:hypothetical protein
MKTGEARFSETSGLILRSGILKKIPERCAPEGSYSDSVHFASDPTKYFRDRLDVTAETARTGLMPKDTTADVKGLPVGLTLQATHGALGSRIFIHEKGHQLAHELLFQRSTGYVQVDGLQNINNFFRDPSMDLFRRIISEYDVDQNHFGGYYVTTSSGGPNDLGKNFTDSQRSAIVSATGSILEGLFPLGAFAFGFKLRKKHPLTGYSLMTFGALGFMRAASYPFSAIFPEVRALGEGHDWTNVANQTGINPVLTATAFASALPVLAVVLYAMEKIGENRTKDGIALSNLLATGGITLKELNKAFARYPGKEKMAEADEALMSAAATPLSRADEKSAKKLAKALGAARKEYGKFSNFLLGEFRDRIAEERNNVDRQFPKMTLHEMLHSAVKGFGEKWKQDRPGAVLAGASAAISGSVLAASISRAIPNLIIESRGITPSNMYGVFNLLAKTSQTLEAFLKASVPAAGLAGVAYSYYQAGKVLRDANAPMLDKAAAVMGAIFSGVVAAGVVMIPGLAVPLMMIGIAGQIGTHVSKKIVEKSDFFEK